MSYAVLLVEDDALIGQGLELGLNARGFDVHWEQSGSGATRSLIQRPPDVVILDLGLPDVDGMELLMRLRQADNFVPVIILTGRDSIKNRIEGLDVGADDYVIKPVSTDELAARIRAAARRNTGRASEMIQCGEISIDTRTRKVKVGSNEVNLTQTEYQVLGILASNIGKVFSTETLLSRLDQASKETTQQALKVHIHSLRKKLNTGAIQTVRGVGYLITSD